MGETTVQDERLWVPFTPPPHPPHPTPPHPPPHPPPTPTPIPTPPPHPLHMVEGVPVDLVEGVLADLVKGVLVDLVEGVPVDWAIGILRMRGLSSFSRLSVVDCKSIRSSRSFLTSSISLFWIRACSTKGLIAVVSASVMMRPAALLMRA